jgi:hypothetical protein
MVEGGAYQHNRLDERGWIDRWGFLLFAFGGAAGILVAKTTGMTAIPVAVGAAVAMVAYATVVQTSGTGRLRADQAGDNCYYLGLIYTLISLAYAIFFFDPAATATTVVQGFGIALATTIMGLILRVFFNQSRVDLVQTEDTARIELAEAAGRLKAELQGITVSMSDYGRETRQALEELRTQVVDALVDVQAEAIKAISATSTAATEAISAASTSSREAVASMSAEATEAITQQSAEAVARARRLSTATDKVVASIEQHAEAMGGIEKASGAIAAGLASLEVAADRTQQNLGHLSQRAEGISAAQSSLARTGDDLRAAVSALVEQVKGFDATATRFDAAVMARLADLTEVPSGMASRTADAFARASNAMEQQIASISKAQQDLADEIARRTGESAAVLDRHNVELEQHLNRSRTNVTRVHDALVEMTGTLVARVQTADA